MIDKKLKLEHYEHILDPYKLALNWSKFIVIGLGPIIYLSSSFGSEPIPSDLIDILLIILDLAK